MPLADPAQRMARHPPAFTRAEIDDIVGYVEEIAPGGPAIPPVDAAAGDVAFGRTIYADNCLACHGAGLQGSSVGGGAVAPSLSRASPREIAEAVRIGPGVMPPFGPDVIDAHALDSLVRYIEFERRARQPGGLGIGRVGPVAEGFIAWFVGLGILLVVLRLGGKRT
jgi:ubiquinol-cytochrome c reductase cytochrome c subunit